MRKPYKTKKRKAEFKATYAQIGQLNQYILNIEIEIKTAIKYSIFDEAISKQKEVNEMKLELLNLGKDGWDIDYFTEMVSGLEVKITTPELE